MTVRPVSSPADKRPFYRRDLIQFDWNPGQAPAQKQKNFKAIHDGYVKKHPDADILEVSTKSDNPLGQSLSPFSLKKQIPSLKKEFPVENVYQASKVFKKGGPYVDLLGCTPLQAKRDSRLENSSDLVHFDVMGKKYPADPDILFYNWLYISALREHPGLAREVLKHNAFTDVEFNPDTGTNNQARACAIYTALAKNGLLDQAADFESFKNLMLHEDITAIEDQHKAAEMLPQMSGFNQTVRRRTFKPGDWLEHPGIGKGEVIKRNKDTYLINFRVSGPRTIARDYIEKNCKPL